MNYLVLHKELIALCPQLEQYAELSSTIWSEYQLGVFFVQVNRQTFGTSYSAGSCTSSSGVALAYFSTYTVAVSGFSFGLLSITIYLPLFFVFHEETLLLFTTLWVVGSHRRQPFTSLAYPKNIHFLDFGSSFVVSQALNIMYTRLPSIWRFKQSIALLVHISYNLFNLIIVDGAQFTT